MQKTKILAVAPYEGMADILTDIAPVSYTHLACIVSI